MASTSWQLLKSLTELRMKRRVTCFLISLICLNCQELNEYRDSKDTGDSVKFTTAMRIIRQVNIQVTGRLYLKWRICWRWTLNCPPVPPCHLLWLWVWGSSGLFTTWISVPLLSSLYLTQVAILPELRWVATLQVSGGREMGGIKEARVGPVVQ